MGRPQAPLAQRQRAGEQRIDLGRRRRGPRGVRLRRQLEARPIDQVLGEQRVPGPERRFEDRPGLAVQRLRPRETPQFLLADRGLVQERHEPGVLRAQRATCLLERRRVQRRRAAGPALQAPDLGQVQARGGERLGIGAAGLQGREPALQQRLRLVVAAAVLEEPREVVLEREPRGVLRRELRPREVEPEAEVPFGRVQPVADPLELSHVVVAVGGLRLEARAERVVDRPRALERRGGRGVIAELEPQQPQLAQARGGLGPALTERARADRHGALGERHRVVPAPEVVEQCRERREAGRDGRVAGSERALAAGEAGAKQRFGRRPRSRVARQEQPPAEAVEDRRRARRRQALARLAKPHQRVGERRRLVPSLRRHRGFEPPLDRRACVAARGGRGRQPAHARQRQRREQGARRAATRAGASDQGGHGRGSW